jgi:hypothetical protein
MRLLNRKNLRHLALMTAGVAIGAFVVAGPYAGAGTLTTNTAKTGHLTMAASAFAPDGLHDTTEDYFNEWDPTTLSNEDSGRCFNAGAVLPNGAKLTSVTVYYTEGSVDMYFELNRQDLATHAGVELVSFDTSTATTPTYTETTFDITSNATVNTAKYAYSFGTCPSGNTTFSGVTVTYTTG